MSQREAKCLPGWQLYSRGLSCKVRILYTTHLELARGSGKGSDPSRILGILTKKHLIVVGEVKAPGWSGPPSTWLLPFQSPHKELWFLGLGR